MSTILLQWYLWSLNAGTWLPKKIRINGNWGFFMPCYAVVPFWSPFTICKGAVGQFSVLPKPQGGLGSILLWWVNVGGGGCCDWIWIISDNITSKSYLPWTYNTVFYLFSCINKCIPSFFALFSYNRNMYSNDINVAIIINMKWLKMGP